MSVASFPPLPDDIERLIFEYAAEMDTKAGFRLVFVAKHVQRWMEPILYRTIILPAGKRVQSLAFTLRVNEALGRYIRRISCLYNGFYSPSLLPLDDLCSILTSCYRLKSLSIGPRVMFMWAGKLARGQLVRDATFRIHALALPLTSLTCPMRLLELNPSHPDFSQPTYRSITHLELHDGLVIENWPALKNLRCLRNLIIHCPEQIPRRFPPIPAFLNEDLTPFLPATLETVVVFFLLHLILAEVSLDWITRECDPRITIGTMSRVSGDDIEVQHDSVVLEYILSGTLLSECFPDALDNLWARAKEIRDKRFRTTASDEEN